jgi:hypothetical protein
MAKSAAERALEILAEIDEQEKKKSDTKPQDNGANKTETVLKSSKTNISKPQDDLLSSENIVDDISKLDKNDIVKGIIMSEILNKPVALRRNRRI